MFLHFRFNINIVECKFGLLAIDNFKSFSFNINIVECKYYFKIYI